MSSNNTCFLEKLEKYFSKTPVIFVSLFFQIFFTRNGKIVGQKQICIPKGGFYPTVGMLSSCEKVKVDLRPLTG